MIIRGYCEQFYGKKFENLDDKILGEHNLPRQERTKIENLNSAIKEE